MVRSPGRINILGEHTDYNEGFVLPAAIDRAAYLAMSLRNDHEIRIVALDFNDSFSTTVPELRPLRAGSWPNFILGAAAQFVKKGITLTGFNAIITSDIPIGAGLSSSAAVECATVFALNVLLKTNYERIELIKMAQNAEHEFAGVMCGIMDQFASMMGRKDNLIKLDCQSLQYEYVPLHLTGHKILLLNSNVKHSLAASAYNQRRKECETAVAWIREKVSTIHSLRSATEPMLDQYVLPKDEQVYKRSRYVVQEIARLLDGCADLQQGDLIAIGKKMFLTHDGLSKMFEVSCTELDWMVDRVRHQPAVLGARMMGGGFGGCTINLVQENAMEDLVSVLQVEYQKKFQLPLTSYVVSIEDGTEIIDD